MNECVPRDTLVTLTSAADGPILPLIDHVATCPDCRKELAALARIRAELTVEEPLPPGFVDRVMGRTAGQDAPPEPTVEGLRVRPGHPGKRGRLADVALAVLVAAAVFVVLQVGSLGQLQGRTPAGDAVHVVGSLIAAAVALRAMGRAPWMRAPDTA